ncbi:uncharacterized protein A4U43_C03F22010 [Asparagus officinalis]|uniref:Uncharacterized protein n=1 Tax=Asparagus officinalis TaxID=4686 RepID=A0A5P1FCZ7_ASPOF|nr:uncharacterized protein LOC109834197 [Asparagus officinalis]ONK75924.1 uncharacterized protein A4U43_C03F22010 [Asparagus officinalis]
MALPSGTLAALNRPAVSSKMLAVENLRTFTTSFKGNGYGRRSLLSLVLLSTASAASNASDSRTALLQEYIKKSKENKARNDKERLDDYYKRNYKDYFELVEGSVQGKSEEQLSEAEKQIREWLRKNKE